MSRSGPTCSTLAFVGPDVIVTAPDVVLRDQTVLIVDGRIACIGAREAVAIPSGTTTVDARGRFLAPALADMHAHPFTAEDLAVYLAAGVTTIRAMWGEPSLLALRRRVEAGEIPGPRIVTGGRLVDGDPPHFFGTHAVGTTEQAEAVVAANVADGYDFVKVYDKLLLPAFDAIAAASRQHGTEFAGHVSRYVPLFHAMASGMRSGEHLFSYLPAVQRRPTCMHLERWFFPGYGDAVVNFERMGRGELRIEDEVSTDLIAELAERAARHGFWTVPTLVVLRSIVGLTRYTATHPFVRYMAPSTADDWRAIQARRAANYSADFYRGFDLWYGLNQQIVAAVHAAGGGLLVGTDAPNPGVPTGFAVVDEIEYLIEAGLSPAAAFRAATSEAARFFGREGEFGVVREGAHAELLLLEQDPREVPGTLRSPLGVMCGHAWRGRSDVDALLDDIATAVRERTAGFEDAPDLGGAGQAAWFVSSAGDRALLRREARSCRASVRMQGGPWCRFDAEWTQTSRRVRCGLRELEILVHRDGGYIRVHGEDVSEHGVGNAWPVSGTVLDAILFTDALSWLAPQKSTELETWRCPTHPAEAIDGARWTATRLADDTVDGAFYYTGCRVYRLSRESGTGADAITLWIGGGFSEGDPVRIEERSGELVRSWSRCR